MIELEEDGTVSHMVATVIPTRLSVGEGPRWDAERQRWTWIDIYTGRYFEQGSTSPAAVFPVPLGCTVRHEDGSVLGASADGFYRWDRSAPPARVSGLPVEVKQLNDGRCDRAGRWWVGGVDAEYRDGVLLRVELDGSIAVVAHGYRLPNGIDWLADGRTMLHSDSYAHAVYAYDFDEESGSATNRRVWWAGSPEDGYPDGLAVADDGTVWVAFWGGGVVRRFDPDGRLRAVLRMPVQQPSSIAFGGARGDEAFITSAFADLPGADDASTPDGDAFLIRGLGRVAADNLCRVRW